MVASLILGEALPDSIVVSGVEYPLNTDYRYALRIMLAFEDKDLSYAEKFRVLLENLFEEVPENLDNTILVKAMRFLNGGQSQLVAEDTPDSDRVYSFSGDGDLIFSAFNSTHRIDLQETPYLHWWKFLSYFMDLGEDTTFCSLVGLRGRYYRNECTKEEKAAILRMGKRFEVDVAEILTLEEMESQRKFDAFVEQARNA